MEVKLYTRNDYIDYRSLTSTPDSTDVPAAKEKHQENYDTVTIHADFSKSMTQAAAADESGTTSQRILFLRQQVATGAYQPDSRRIAECMLVRRSQPGIF